MADTVRIQYEIHTQQELNLSYMPFIVEGGLFIPTTDTFRLGEHIIVDLKMPGQTEVQQVEGKVIWITPKNALYEVYQGIGIQLIGDNAKAMHEQIKTNLDNTIEVGGYTYGVSDPNNIK